MRIFSAVLSWTEQKEVSLLTRTRPTGQNRTEHRRCGLLGLCVHTYRDAMQHVRKTKNTQKSEMFASTHTQKHDCCWQCVCVFFTWKLYQLDQRTAGFNLLSAVCVSDHVGVIRFLCQIFSLSPILSRSRHHPHFLVFSDSFFDQFHSNTETRGNCS